MTYHYLPFVRLNFTYLDSPGISVTYSSFRGIVKNLHLLALIPYHLSDLVDFLLTPFVEEMIILGQYGIEIYDSHLNRTRRLYCKLLRAVMDLMARRSVC